MGEQISHSNIQYLVGFTSFFKVFGVVDTDGIANCLQLLKNCFAVRIGPAILAIVFFLMVGIEGYMTDLGNNE